MSMIELSVNQRAVRISAEPRTNLADFVRDKLDLTGTHLGCEHGVCGACTVLVNGVRINACLSLAVMHQGDTVTTIEGLGSPERLHPMQAAFVRHDGYQCGYCTPGQICSAVAMLDEVRAGVPSHVQGDLLAPPQPTNVELRERMSGNLCRCGSHNGIVAAIAETFAEAAE